MTTLKGVELSKTLSMLSPTQRVDMLKLSFTDLISKANSHIETKEKKEVPSEVKKMKRYCEQDRSSKRPRQQEEEKPKIIAARPKRFLEFKILQAEDKRKSNPPQKVKNIKKKEKEEEKKTKAKSMHREEKEEEKLKIVRQKQRQIEAERKASRRKLLELETISRL